MREVSRTNRTVAAAGLAIWAIAVASPTGDEGGDAALSAQSQTQPPSERKPGPPARAQPDVGAVPLAATSKPFVEHKPVQQPGSALVWGTVHTESGSILTHEIINLYSITLGKRYSAISDINGHFYIDGVLPGNDYRVTVAPQGNLRPYDSGPFALAPEQRAISVVLQELPVGTLQGVVMNTDGHAVSGFGIRVRSPEKPLWAATAITDVAGGFRFENVPLGKLEMSSTFGPPLMISGLEFTGDLQPPPVLIVDQGANALTGRVFDQYDQPIAGAGVVLRWASVNRGIRSVVNRHTTTNQSGQFALFGLGGGVHDLVLTSNDGRIYWQTIDVSFASELTITLPPLPN